MRISDWSSDVCSSDLGCRNAARAWPRRPRRTAAARQRGCTSRRWTCGLSGRRRGCCQYNTNRTRTGNEVTAAEGAGSGVPGRDVARLAFLLLPGLLLPSLLSCLVRPALVQRRDLAERRLGRSEEHTSELQSLKRISYAVFCLKKKN